MTAVGRRERVNRGAGKGQGGVMVVAGMGKGVIAALKRGEQTVCTTAREVRG